MGITAAPPRDYVVHAASPTRNSHRRDFGRPSPFKRGAGLPYHRNLIIVGHHSSLFLFLNRAKLSHLHFLIYLSLYSSSYIPPALHTSRFTYLSHARSKKKPPYRTKWTAAALSRPSRKAVSPRATPRAAPPPSSRPRPHPPPGDPTMQMTQILFAITTTLQPEQMEVLFCRLLRQGQPHDAVAPAATAAFAPSAGLFPYPSLRSSFHFRSGSQPSTPSTSEIS